VGRETQTTISEWV